jgi:hypothetical protein
MKLRIQTASFAANRHLNPNLNPNPHPESANHGDIGRETYIYAYSYYIETRF